MEGNGAEEGRRGKVDCGRKELGRSGMDRLIKWDVEASYAVWKWYKDTVGSNLPCQLLEASGHGVLWYVFVLASFFGVPRASPRFYALMGNYFIGLTTDIIIICILKPLIKRKRPHYNPGKTHLSLQAVDQHSFPSGHATRVSVLACLTIHATLVYSWPPKLVCFLVALWSITVMESRVMLGRHHILDIIAGALVGILNAVIIVKYLRFDSATAVSLRNFILSKVQSFLYR